MLEEDGGLVTAECREPASSDRLPVHRSESPTGYSSAGCSPAEPASASPVTENTSSIPIRRGNQMRCSSRRRPALGCGARARRIRRQPECHLYFARPVSFLSCADMTFVLDGWLAVVFGFSAPSLASSSVSFPADSLTASGCPYNGPTGDGGVALYCAGDIHGSVVFPAGDGTHQLNIVARGDLVYGMY